MEKELTYEIIMRRLELSLKPKFKNDIYTWAQVEKALYEDVFQHSVKMPVSGSNISRDGYKINIDGRWFTHPNKLITGSELLMYRNIWGSNDHAIYKKCSGDDEEIGDAKQVDLSEAEQTHFYTSLRRVNGG